VRGGCHGGRGARMRGLRGGVCTRESTAAGIWDEGVGGWDVGSMCFDEGVAEREGAERLGWRGLGDRGPSGAEESRCTRGWGG